MTSAHLQNLLKLKACLDLLVKAEQQTLKTAEARSKLDPGTSRARVTTANARWMRSAEYRDLKDAEFSKLLAECGY